MYILCVSCENEAEVSAYCEAVQSCCDNCGYVLGDKMSYGVTASCIVTRNMGYCHAEVELCSWSGEVMANFEEALAPLI